MPEVVPFRLTQTLVEALGIAGAHAATPPPYPTSAACKAPEVRQHGAPVCSAHATHLPHPSHPPTPCLPPTAGPEGRFRLGCERTLRALRANAAPLVALLGAALCDPGVDWDAEAAAKAASKVGNRGSRQTDWMEPPLLSLSVTSSRLQLAHNNVTAQGCPCPSLLAGLHLGSSAPAVCAAPGWCLCRAGDRSGGSVQRPVCCQLSAGQLCPPVPSRCTHRRFGS